MEWDLKGQNVVDIDVELGFDVMGFDGMGFERSKYH